LGGSGVLVLGDAGRPVLRSSIGTSTTRSSSSTLVSPFNTCCTPLSNSDFIPLALAASAILSRRAARSDPPLQLGVHREDLDHRESPGIRHGAIGQPTAR
jgi:hypothetical protein